MTDYIILSIYSLLLLKRRNYAFYAFVAYLVCVVIAYTPVWDKMTEVQISAVFAIIYCAAATRIKRISTAVLLLLVGLANLWMIADYVINDGGETYYYSAFPVVVILLHSSIIISIFDRIKPSRVGRLDKSPNRERNHVFHFLRRWDL